MAMTINNHNAIFLLKTGNATQCHAASWRAFLPENITPTPKQNQGRKRYWLASASGKKWLVSISGLAIGKGLAIFGRDAPAGGT
jgi:hypothetical protein